jgi:hypothetical protein
MRRLGELSGTMPTPAKNVSGPTHGAIPTDLPELLEAIILSNDRIEAERSYCGRLYERLREIKAEYQAMFKGAEASSTDRRSVPNVARNLKISVRRALERAIRADLTAEEALAKMTVTAAESAMSYGIDVPQGVNQYTESLFRRYDAIKAEKLESKRLNELSAE